MVKVQNSLTVFSVVDWYPTATTLGGADRGFSP